MVQPESMSADRHSYPKGALGISWVHGLVPGRRGLRRIGSMPAKDVGHGAKVVPRALMAVLCIELAWAVGARDAMLATASMVVMNACL